MKGFEKFWLNIEECYDPKQEDKDNQKEVDKDLQDIDSRNLVDQGYQDRDTNGKGRTHCLRIKKK